MGLEAPADGEDGPLQLGGDALGAVVGPGPVEEALGAGLEVAAPPLVEPGLGATDGGADGLDIAAGEAQGNGSMTSSEFVVHGYLRVAAASGCPRGSFYTSDQPGGSEMGPSFWEMLRHETQRCAGGPG